MDTNSHTQNGAHSMQWKTKALAIAQGTVCFATNRACAACTVAINLLVHSQFLFPLHNLNLQVAEG